MLGTTKSAPFHHSFYTSAKRHICKHKSFRWEWAGVYKREITYYVLSKCSQRGQTLTTWQYNCVIFLLRMIHKPTWVFCSSFPPLQSAYPTIRLHHCRYCAPTVATVSPSIPQPKNLAHSFCDTCGTAFPYTNNRLPTWHKTTFSC